MRSEMIGICGAYCEVCDWKEKTNCPGCQTARSNLFWGQCGVAKCAVAKGFLHCGLCPELPCKTLEECFHHPEHGDRGERLANLKTWATGGKTYLVLRNLGAGEGQP